MTILVNEGDGVIGERLRVEHRKATKPVIVTGSARHRQQLMRVIGTPARCFIEKKVRSLE